MRRSFPVLRGRGADHDPPNRFERLHLEPLGDGDTESGRGSEEEGEAAGEGEVAEGASGPIRPTEYFLDHSRSVLTRNHSPDVGFDWSLNPYRGCEHGCVYCLAPETEVLSADLTSRPLWTVAVGDSLLGFDEYPKVPGHPRKLRPTEVLAVWWSRKPTTRLVTDQSEVITTVDHRWLQARSFRWSATRRLRVGQKLRHLPVIPDEEFSLDYRLGYVSGMSIGDATFRYEPGWRSDKLGFPAAYWRLALVDDEPLERMRAYLRGFGVRVEIRPFAAAEATRKPLRKIETRSLPQLDILHHLFKTERTTRPYRRGFLAGFFDAEGHNGTSLRLSQKDTRVLERVRRYGSSLGLDLRLEKERPNGVNTLRLHGSIADRLRFLAICRPAIARKRDVLFGAVPPTTPDVIRAVEPGPVMHVMDIQTSTGTFYAAGLATHNCYARPTHEYLGLSAGLDFESKIFVKLDAPKLLEERLASPRWIPEPVTMSSVTDCYQPIERRLRLTRSCLEVFARTRNPVAIVTKNRLIERDVDLFGELATHEAVHVAVSITTLDRSLQRALEPRASPPEHRLAAVRTLAEAGVPVTVFVAPVIPGITDHEIPAIVAAAAEAGARGVGYVLLRLPGAVEPLFLSWMDDHCPDRAEKVKSRLRSLRDGKLNESAFGKRMRGEGPFAEQIERLFEVAKVRAGIREGRVRLSTAHFLSPNLSAQTELFFG